MRAARSTWATTARCAAGLLAILISLPGVRAGVDVHAATRGRTAIGRPASGSQAAAEAVLQRALNAKGGLERLRSIRTIKVTGQMTVATGGARMKVAMTSYLEYPDKFRLDATLPHGELTQVYADGRAWVRDPSGVREVEGPARDSLRAGASRDTLRLLVRAAAAELATRIVETEPGDPADADALELSGRDASPVVVFVQRSTGAIVGERYVVEQPGTIGTVPTREEYSEYRDVDGVRVPFTTVVRRGEAVLVERTLSHVWFNVPFGDDLFTRPAK